MFFQCSCKIAILVKKNYKIFKKNFPKPSQNRSKSFQNLSQIEKNLFNKPIWLNILRRFNKCEKTRKTEQEAPNKLRSGALDVCWPHIFGNRCCFCSVRELCRRAELSMSAGHTFWKSVSLLQHVGILPLSGTLDVCWPRIFGNRFRFRSMREFCRRAEV